MAALPGTCVQIALSTGLARKSVNNALRILRKIGDAYPEPGSVPPRWVVSGPEDDIGIADRTPSSQALARRNSIYNLCTSPLTRRKIATALGIPPNTLAYDLEWLIDSGQIERVNKRDSASEYIRSGGFIPESFRTASGLWSSWTGVNNVGTVPNGQKYSADTRHPTPQPNNAKLPHLGSSLEVFINSLGRP